MKVSFAELIAWAEGAWPDGYIWSGDTAMPDGRDIYGEDGSWNPGILPHEMVDLSLFEGIELEERIGNDAHERSVESEIRKWRKANSESALVVTIPKTDIEEFRALCATRKWKIK